MNPKLVFFGLVALAVALEIAADILLKKWSIESRTAFLAIGLLVYFIGTVFWAVSLKYEHLSKAISLFTIFNLMCIALVGVFYFKEDLSLTNKIGIALGLVSVFLIEA